MQESVDQHWTLGDLKQALSGVLVAVKGDTRRSFPSITTDSRSVKKGQVFVARSGEKFDGHVFALAAEKAGAGALVLSRSVGATCPELIVKDTAEAYGLLARFWRRRFALPLIAVAGSNGKTTTTQMIGSVLRAYAGDAAFCTRGNLNNNVGVPRMLITNAQREHQAYIDGPAGSARENAMAIVALPESGCAVLPLTDSCYRIWADFVRARGCRVLTYSAGESDADVVATRQDDTLVLSTPEGLVRFPFSMAGDHALHDAAAAAAACLAAGVSLRSVMQGLSAFTALAGRGQVHRFENGAVLIDEAYNANPDSMRAAIDLLAKMPSPRILVAGEMGELGEKSAAYHEEVLRYAQEKGIDRIYLIGGKMHEAMGVVGRTAQFFPEREELTRAVQEALECPCTVLVKASHYMGLESVVRSATTGRIKGS